MTHKKPFYASGIYGLRFLLAALIAALGSLGAGSVSASGPSAIAHTAGAARIKPPADVARAGKLVFCSDISYPPEEFYQGTTAEGSDIDIGAALARLMGVKAQFDNTGFDGIILALQSHKCDAVMSGMSDTAKRRKQVAFVDYLNIPQSLMVPKGNPAHIMGWDGLAGKTVGCQISTTEYDYLVRESARLKATGKSGITVVTYNTDTDGANALKAGKLDAYASDYTAVTYYVSKDPTRLQFIGRPINPLPIGIAIRKDDPALSGAVQKAVDALYKNGAMTRILAKWHLSASALKK